MVIWLKIIVAVLTSKYPGLIHFELFARILNYNDITAAKPTTYVRTYVQYKLKSTSL